MYFLVHTWRNDFKKNCKSYKGQGNVFFSIDLGGMTLKKSQFLQVTRLRVNENLFLTIVM